MQEHDSTDEQDALVTPTGWTPEQMEKLSPALGEGIARAVRSAESDGLRLRCGAPPRGTASVSVVLLDARGEHTRLRGEDGISTPRCEAMSAHLVAAGLAVRSVGEYAIGVSVQPIGDLNADTPGMPASETKETPAARRRGTIAR